MLTFRVISRVVRDGQLYTQIAGECLSTDTKPTETVDIPLVRQDGTGAYVNATEHALLMNGSYLIEMDTSKILFYNEEGKTWPEFGG